MPVKAWTGLPGAGKTACMVAAILQFKKDHPERPVFAININGLDPSVAEPLTLEQLHKWWELPPGALICIDECQEDDFFPLDRGQPPEWVKRISKVRHEGMDFWMTTQHPNLMSAYVRRLMDQHVHSVRKFNSQVVSRFTWGRCMENCEKGAAQKVAVHTVGTLPKEVFELYKSSNAHNMKMRVPFRAWMLPVLGVVALCALVAIPLVIKKLKAQTDHTPTAAAGVTAAPGAKPGAPQGSEADRLRREDFAKWMKPRVDGLPWSAPMFDGLSVRSNPRLYCIAVDDGRCTCHTEQGTRYAVPADRCRQIAADGLYNPFADGLELARNDGQKGERESVQPQAPTSVPSEPNGVEMTGIRKERVTAAAYDPPTYKAWNSDPFGGGKGGG
ncbi:zonular occludens toxin domain-containing protein [Dyella japonica]|uniref:Zona occludens toxin N-terminal domain-containing protein n=1 Tax=Dyella japonica TaxID=231455 RepID=A0ABV2JQT4_9GAMM